MHALDTISMESKTKIKNSLPSSSGKLISLHQSLYRPNMSPFLTTLCALGVLIAAEDDNSQISMNVWK